jgi:hypothetical protein
MPSVRQYIEAFAVHIYLRFPSLVSEDSEIDQANSIATTFYSSCSVRLVSFGGSSQKYRMNVRIGRVPL